MKAKQLISPANKAKAKGKGWCVACRCEFDPWPYKRAGAYCWACRVADGLRRRLKGNSPKSSLVAADPDRPARIERYRQRAEQRLPLFR